MQLLPANLGAIYNVCFKNITGVNIQKVVFAKRKALLGNEGRLSTGKTWTACHSLSSSSRGCGGCTKSAETWGKL